MRVVHVLRKPLSEGTVARNVVKHCAGGINIDASRIVHDEPLREMKAQSGGTRAYAQSGRYEATTELKAGGRWPANVILAHLAGCVCEGTKRVEGRGAKVSDVGLGRDGDHTNGIYGAKASKITTAYVAEDGKEVVAAWNCERGCPVADLDQQSGDRSSPWVGNINRGEKGGLMFGGVSANPTDLSKPEYRDTGGASRFFKQIGGSE